jgi:hypothetical protein
MRAKAPVRDSRDASISYRRNQRLLACSYEEARDAIDLHMKRRDRIGNPDKLGKLLLDTIIDQMDSHSEHMALVDASLKRMGFAPMRRGDHMEIDYSAA